MSASPAPRRTCTSGSSPTAASTACGNRPSPRASSTNCRKPMSRSPKPATPMAATAAAAFAAGAAAIGRPAKPLRRLALRQCRRDRRQGRRLLLQHLRDARLAARAAEPHRSDRPQLGLALRPPGRAHRLWRDRFSGYGAGRSSVKGRTIEGELVAKSVSDTPSPFSDRRPRVPPEIRQRQHRRDRRQQADHRLRQGRAEAGAGRVCERGVRSSPTVPRICAGSS